MEFSLEAYFKTLSNLLSYQENSNVLNLEQDLTTTGTGNSRGLELFVQKKHGRTTGLLSYNLSWTTKQFAAFTFGREFPYRYDRRHNINIAVSNKLTANIEFSANWIYGTGDAFSLPGVKYVKTVLPIYRDLVKDEIIYEEEARKNLRIRACHRLDINLRFYKRKKNSEQVLSISLYNIYSRKNPYFLHFEDNSSERPAIKPVSLFPIIPLISYSFTF